MKKSIILTMITLMTFFCCSKEKKGDSQQAQPEKALAARLGDFERNSEIRTYDAENLQQYIDAVEEFARYGFEKLATAEYVRNDTTLAVDVYLFSSVQGAFLLYSKYSDTLTESTDLGTASFISPGELSFWRDRYFVHLNCRDMYIPEKTLWRIGLAIDSLLIGDDDREPSAAENHR
jgi:hypothetical protein